MKHLQRIAIATFLSLTLFSCKKDIDTTEQQKLSQIDPAIGDYWTQFAVPDVDGPPTAVEYHLSFSLNQKVYVVVSDYNQLWEYSPATNVWSKKQNTFFRSMKPVTQMSLRKATAFIF
jgi:hypothetical protein